MHFAGCEQMIIVNTERMSWAHPALILEWGDQWEQRSVNVHWAPMNIGGLSQNQTNQRTEQPGMNNQRIISSSSSSSSLTSKSSSSTTLSPSSSWSTSSSSSSSSWSTSSSTSSSSTTSTLSSTPSSSSTSSSISVLWKVYDWDMKQVWLDYYLK